MTNSSKTNFSFFCKKSSFLIVISIFFFGKVTIKAQSDFTELIGDSGDNYFQEIKYINGAIYGVGYILEGGNRFGIFSKINTTGGVDWTLKMNSQCTFRDFELNPSGDFILVGRTEPVQVGGAWQNNASVIAKVDNAGNLVWMRTYELDGGREGFLSIQNNYIVGALNNNPGGNPNSVDDIILCNIDNQGNILWMRLYEEPIGNDDQWGRDLFITSSGDIAMVGDYLSSTPQGLIVTTNTSGVITNVYDFGTSGRFFDGKLIAGNNHILVGDSNGQGFIARTGSSLDNILWSVRIPAQTRLFKVIVGTNNDIYALGTTNIGGVNRTVINKFSQGTSNLEWTKYFDNGEVNFNGGAITTDLAGSVFYADNRTDNTNGFGANDHLLVRTDNNLNSCITQSLTHTTTSFTLSSNTKTINEMSFASTMPFTSSAFGISYSTTELCCMNLSVTTIPNTSVCENESIVLTTNITNNNGAFTCQWSPTLGLSDSNDCNPTLSGLTFDPNNPFPIIYGVIVTDAAGCTAQAATEITVLGAPTATASSDSPKCEGETLSLTCTPTGNNFSYLWTFPNGQTSNLQNPSIPNVTMADGGIYTVEITNVFSNCTDVATTTVVINPSPTATVNNNSPICEGETLILTSGPSNNNFSYLWTFPNGQTSNLQNPSIPNVNVANAGTYFVTVTNENGCMDVASTDVIINSIFVTNLTDEIICENEVINFNPIISSTSGSTNCFWSPSFGLSNPNTCNPTLSGLTAGVYPYTLTVTDNTGCSEMITILVTVDPTPVLILGSNATPNPICEGEALNIFETGGDAVDWHWINPSGANIGALNAFSFPNATPAHSGTYFLTITDSEGCTNMGSINVVVLPQNDPNCVNCPGTLTLDMSAADIDCFGNNNGTATATVNGGFPPYQYQWNFGNQNVSTISNLSAGQYCVTVTDAANCVLSDCINIQEPPQLTCSIINQTDIDCDNPNGCATIQCSGGTPPYAYNWSNGESTETACFNVCDFYQVTVTDANLCSFTTEIEILCIPDEVPPIIACPNDITVTCSQVVNYLDPIATDNCSCAPTISFLNGLPSGSNFPVGIHTNCFLATDCNGNMSSCCFNVTVEECDNDCDPVCQTNSLIINTGYDNVNNVPYNIGDYDAFWTLVATPDANISVPRPARTIFSYPSWHNQANTRWISPYTIPGFNGGSIQGDPYVFERCFCVCEDNTDIIIDMDILVDNIVDVNLVDDQGNFIQTLASQTDQSDNAFKNPPFHVNVPVILNSGTYCLQAELRNDGSTAMGLNIEGTISGINLLSSVCCSPNSSITGYKFHDENCNGLQDAGEPNLAGWQIDLCDNSGVVITSAITDNFGLYTFNGLAPGSYQVKEVGQTGWVQTFPAGNIYNVNLGVAEVAGGLAFGNCEEPCVEIQNQELVCTQDGGPYKYTFEVNNGWVHDICEMEVDFIIPATVAVNPDPIAITPCIPPNTISPPICVDFDNIGAATEIQVRFKIKNDSDTLYCFSEIITLDIPECPPCTPSTNLTTFSTTIESPENAGVPNDEWAYSGIQASNGEYIFVGTVDKLSPLISNFPLYIGRVGIGGNVLQTKYIEHPGQPVARFSQENMHIIEVESGGYLVAAGFTENFDWWETMLLRFDANLDLQWSKKLPSPPTSKIGLSTLPNMVIQDSNGDFVIVGNSNVSGLSTVFVARWNESNSINACEFWTYSVNNNAISEGLAIEQVSGFGNLEYVITGKTNDNVLLLGIDNALSYLTSRHFPLSSAGLEDVGYSVKQIPGTLDLLVCGETQSSIGSNFFVMKVKGSILSFGTVVWARKGIGVIPGQIELARDIYIKNASQYIISGQFYDNGDPFFNPSGNGILMELNQEGELNWSRKYDDGNSITEVWQCYPANDGGYVLFGNRGNFNMNTNQISSDVWISKTADNGVLSSGECFDCEGPELEDLLAFGLSNQFSQTDPDCIVLDCPMLAPDVISTQEFCGDSIVVDCNATASFITSLQSPCGETFTFQDLSTGTLPLTYDWNFGNGITSTSQFPPAQTYPSSGNYTVTLNVTDADGCTSTFSQNLAVSIWPDPPVTISCQPNECQEVTCNITQGAAGLNSWDFGDGTVIIGTANETHTYAIPGTYTICLTKTIIGCTSVVCETVTVEECCCADEDLFCDKVEAGFTVSQTCDLIQTCANDLDECHRVTWIWGDGTSDVITNPGIGNNCFLGSHTYSNYGNYNVCMQVEEIDENGQVCWTKTHCKNVPFFDQLVAIPHTIGDPELCCWSMDLNLGRDISQVEFTILTPGVTFINDQANFPYAFNALSNNTNLIVQTFAHPLPFPANNHTDVFQFCLSPNAGTTTIQVNWYWAPADAPILLCSEEIILECPHDCMSDPPIVSASNSAPVCEGNSFTLNSTGSIGTYFWDGPAGFTSVGQNVTISSSGPEHNGTYCVTVTDSDGCTNSDCTNVVINDCCTPSIPPPCMVCDSLCFSGQNLVLNGDFGVGPGVTLAPAISNINQNGTCAGSSYWISDNARDKCTNGQWLPIQAADCFGNFMIIDGANTMIWQQTVSVVQGQDYLFEFLYFPNVSGGASTSLSVLINNSPIATNIIGTLGIWNRVCQTWTANTTGNITLAINQIAANGFADYGLDEISFRECIPNLMVGITANTEICDNQNTTLNTIVTGAVGNYSCKWTPSANLSNSTDCNPVLLSGLPAGSHIYCVEITDSQGCEAIECITINVECCDPNPTVNTFSDIIYESGTNPEDFNHIGVSVVLENLGFISVVGMSNGYTSITNGDREINHMPLHPLTGAIFQTSRITPNITVPNQLETVNKHNFITNPLTNQPGFINVGSIGNGGLNGTDLLLKMTDIGGIPVSGACWTFDNISSAEVGYDVVQGSDGTILAVGSSRTDINHYNMLLAGITNAGTPFAYSYNFGESTEAFAITELPASFQVANPNQPPYFAITGRIGNDAFLMVVNSTGIPQYQTNGPLFRFDLGFNETGKGIIFDGNDIVIAGNASFIDFFNPSSAFQNLFLLKLTPNLGDFSTQAFRYNIGNSGFESVESLVLGSSGNYVISGGKNLPIGNLAGSPNNSRAYILEIDKNSNSTNWSNEYFDAHLGHEGSEFKRVSPVNDGGYLAIGSIWMNEAAPFPQIGFEQINDIYLIKTDNEGRLETCECSAPIMVNPIENSVIKSSNQPLINGVGSSPIEFEEFFIEPTRIECGQDPDPCIEDECCDLITSSINPYTPIEPLNHDCCFELEIDNQVPDFYTMVRLSPIGNSFDLNLNLNCDPSQWNVAQVGGTIEILSNTGNVCPNGDFYIPVGTYNPIKYCLDNIQQNGQSVLVEWIGCNGLICEQILTSDCVRDCVDYNIAGIECIDETLQMCFTFTNQMSSPVCDLFFNSNTVFASILPNPYQLNPCVPVGTVSPLICVDITNPGNAPELKFEIIATTGNDECLSEEFCIPVPSPCPPAPDCFEVLNQEVVCGSNGYKLCFDIINNATCDVCALAICPIIPNPINIIPNPFPINCIPQGGGTISPICIPIEGIDNIPELKFTIKDFNDGINCCESQELCVPVPDCFDPCECDDCPIPIMDNMTHNSTITVQTSGSNNLEECPLQEVCFTINHTSIGDLSISLLSPSGQHYLVMADDDNDFNGCTGNSADDVNVCIQIGTGNPLSNNMGFVCNGASECLSGNWTVPCGGVTDPINFAQQTPNCDLNDFNVSGNPVNGNWTLFINDGCAVGIGSLENWSLRFACDVDCNTDPCDLVNVDYSEIIHPIHECCYELNTNNQALDTYTKIRLTNLTNQDFDNWSLPNSNWSYGNCANSNCIELISNDVTQSFCPGTFDRYLPVGSDSPLDFCFTNVNDFPQQVLVEWIACDGSICTDILIFECPVEMGCVAIEEECLLCEGDEYKLYFDFVNQIGFPICELEVNILSPAGTTGTQNPITFPCVAPGMNSEQLCLDIGGIASGDEVKIIFNAKDLMGFECLTDTICVNVPECCEEDIPAPGSCCEEPIDVLFIMDNSGSIELNEFNAMVTIAQNAITSIEGGYCNALYAVAHYDGDFGGKVFIEHDFTSSTIAGGINRAFPGTGDDFNSSLGVIIDALNNIPNMCIDAGGFTSLNKRPNANFLIIAFTDGYPMVGPLGSNSPKGSALKPYTNSNILKNPPFNAHFTLVHFEPSIGGVNPVGAAIASPGGIYVGPVDANSGDPFNNIIPRQYIPSDFNTTMIPILGSIPPCPQDFVCCDSLMVISEITNTDSCCYSVDIKNKVGSSITHFEAEVISSDWIFNNGSLMAGTGFQWGPCSPNNQNLCIEHTSGYIPIGTSIDALKFCLTPVTPTAASHPQVVFKWNRTRPDGTEEIVCTDTLTTDCANSEFEDCVWMADEEITCNPDNPYEYFMNFTVTNHSDFDANFVALQDLPPGFGFAFCNSSTAVQAISLPLSPNPLMPGQTSNTLCVKIISPIPILNPTDVCFRLGLWENFDCCHSPMLNCVTLAPCCDPCEDNNILVEEFDAGSPECCYKLDIVNECGYDFFSRIETEILTPGVCFGYHAVGGPDAANWFVLPGSNKTQISWGHNTGFIPHGTSDDAIQFCLDDINNPTEIPQTVVVRWYTPTLTGDSLACVDTLVFECEIPNSNDCLTTSNHILECIPDSSKYRLTFTVTNNSSIPFDATDLFIVVEPPSSLLLTPSGNIFPLSPPLTSGNSRTITTCIESSTGQFPTSESEIILRHRLAFFDGISADTCCYESVLDTIPLLCDSCCTDFDAFCDRVEAGFTHFDDCGELIVCPVALDSCDQVIWNWGDGTTSGPLIGNQCITHLYNQEGIYDMCMLVQELDNDGNICWDKQFCQAVEIKFCDSCDVACFDNFDYTTLNSGDFHFIRDMIPFDGGLAFGISGAGSGNNHVFFWNGTTITQLGNGLNNDVMSLEIYNGKLYAGGKFTDISTGASTTFNGFAFLDDSNPGNPVWQDVSGGISLSSGADVIHDMMVHPQGLVIGGNFNAVGGSNPANNIVIWNDISGWNTAFGGGTNGPVTGLGTFNGNIVAGGFFNSPANAIAVWDGTSWSSLGGGLNGLTIFQDLAGVLAFEEFQGELYVGGSFNSAENTGGACPIGQVPNTQNISKWNPALNCWESVGVGTGSGGTIHDFKVIGNNLIVAGEFIQIGTQNINSLARWNGSQWDDMGVTTPLLFADIDCLPNANNECELYIGGESPFQQLKMSCDSCDSLINIDFTLDTLICVGETISLDPIITGGTPPYSCTWTPPAVADPNSCSTTITPDVFGIYILVLDVEDANGCTTAIQVDFVAVDCPDCCQDSLAFIDRVDAGFSYYFDCNQIIVKPNALDSCDFVTWDWGDGSPLGMSNGNEEISHPITLPGSLTITMLVEEAWDDGISVCWEDSFTRLITFDCNQIAGDLVDLEEEFTFDVSNAPEVEIITPPSLMSTDTYDIDLDNDGSFEILNQSNNFNFDASSFPNFFEIGIRVNRMACNDECTSADFIYGIVDTDEPIKNDFNIYPNPTLDKVNIEFENPIPMNVEFQLFDIQGREIANYHLDIDNRTATLDLQHLVSGVYLVRVNISEQIIFAKIIKQ